MIYKIGLVQTFLVKMNDFLNGVIQAAFLTQLATLRNGGMDRGIWVGISQIITFSLGYDLFSFVYSAAQLPFIMQKCRKSP